MQVVKWLLNVRVDINKCEEKEGWTPLHFAIEAEEWEIVSLLISNFADPELKDWVGHSIHLHAADICFFPMRRSFCWTLVSLSYVGCGKGCHPQACFVLCQLGK